MLVSETPRPCFAQADTHGVAGRIADSPPRQIPSRKARWAPQDAWRQRSRGGKSSSVTSSKQTGREGSGRYMHVWRMDTLCRTECTVRTLKNSRSWGAEPKGPLGSGGREHACRSAAKRRPNQINGTNLAGQFVPRKKKKKKKKLRVRVEFLQASLIDCLIFFLFPAMSQWHDRWAGGRTRLACGWCVDCAWVVRAWCGCRAQNGTEGERVRVAHGQRGWRARRSMPIGSGCHSNAPPNKQRLTAVRGRRIEALGPSPSWSHTTPSLARQMTSWSVRLTV